MNLIHHNKISTEQPRQHLYLFCVLRNEMELLPFFINYYKNLGISHFFFIDNDSSDGSRAYLNSLTDINIMLFHTTKNYRDANCGVDWVNSLLSQYAQDKYCLIVDCDELFTFDRSKFSSLQHLTNDLEKNNNNCVQATLLDMYPEQLNDLYKTGESFFNHSPFFDRYNSEDYLIQEPLLNNGYWLTGGVRKRIFGLRPIIHKYPLIKYNKNVTQMSLGYHFMEENGRITRTSTNITPHETQGVIFHFKFIKPNLIANIEERISRNQDWDDSSEYKTYAEVMKNNNKITFYDKTKSKRILNNSDLLEFFSAYRNHSTPSKPVVIVIAEDTSPADYGDIEKTLLNKNITSPIKIFDTPTNELLNPEHIELHRKTLSKIRKVQINSKRELIYEFFKNTSNSDFSVFLTKKSYHDNFDAFLKDKRITFVMLDQGSIDQGVTAERHQQITELFQ